MTGGSDAVWAEAVLVRCLLVPLAGVVPALLLLGPEYAAPLVAPGGGGCRRRVGGAPGRRRGTVDRAVGARRRAGRPLAAPFCALPGFVAFGGVLVAARSREAAARGAPMLVSGAGLASVRDDVVRSRRPGAAELAAGAAAVALLLVPGVLSWTGDPHLDHYQAGVAIAAALTVWMVLALADGRLPSPPMAPAGFIAEPAGLMSRPPRRVVIFAEAAVALLGITAAALVGSPSF